MNVLELQQLADQRRGRYVRVSDIDRRQLIDTYKKGEDFIALAKKLNIKRSTARSILRTFIDEGRVSAKQRAGTRLRFITEEEAEMIREMKRDHPLITIGQIQMRLQRTSNRVLSKASISRILTNSIRLGKRAKRSGEGGDDDDDQDGMNGSITNEHDELMQLSSDEGTGGGVYIDEDEGDDDEEEGEQNQIQPHNSSLQNLDDFQRFMLRKTSFNGDEPNGNDGPSWDVKDPLVQGNYPATYGSDDDDELSEMDENEVKSSVVLRSEVSPNQSTLNENPPVLNENDNWSSVKAEPVCVFVNRHFDSSDSEQPTNNNDGLNRPVLNAQSTANRRVKMCPICGETNFSRLSHHLTVAHNLNREESLTLLAYTDRSNDNNNNNNNSSLATVSSSPINSSANHTDKSPQQTPIRINTNNQQITSSGLSPPITDPDSNNTNHDASLTKSSTNNEEHSTNYLCYDGKKRLLCPRCNTWVLNLTDHLIKKHHLVSKQERLPFLRLARNRYSTVNPDKTSSNSFLINPIHPQTTATVNRKYQNIIKKYQGKTPIPIPASSSSLMISTHEPSSTNSNQNLLSFNNPLKATPPSKTTNANKEVAVHHKFEQRLSVFRQQFAVTVAMQNSLMQQMELLQRSFVSIEEEWNDMKGEIVQSIS